MFKIIFSMIAIILMSNVQAETTYPPVIYGDTAINQVENCVCYRNKDARKVKSWEIDWADTAMLREVISHCICNAHIDMQKVRNPRRYITPGAKLK